MRSITDQLLILMIETIFKTHDYVELNDQRARLEELKGDM